MNDIVVNWFEIPVRDLARAQEFYGTVLQTEIGEIPGPDGEPMKVLQSGGNPAGALVKELGEPNPGGVRVYFHSDDIPAALERAKNAGGSVVVEATSIGPYGSFGQFADSEGNVIALHSPPAE